MTTIEFVEEIKKQCAFLEEDGYVFNHKPNRVWYEKNEEKEGFVISFNYLVYDIIDVYGLTATKRFNEVESVFSRIMNSRLEDLYTIDLTFDGDRFRELINPEILPTKDNYHFELSGATHVASYAALINAFYRGEVLPFFAIYATVNNVNDWVTSQPVDEHSKLITSHGNTMVLRRIMIMYCAGDKGYTDLLTEYKEYAKAKSNKSPFDKIYQNLIEMEKQLDPLP